MFKYNIYISLSLTNRDDIIANSFSIITANGSVVDVLDAVQGSIVGLPPSSLNTIEKLSAAISNDPNYFQTMQTSVNTKAPISTTYTKTQVDGAVGLKADLSNTYTKAEVNAFLDGKPDDSELIAAVDSKHIDRKETKQISCCRNTSEHGTFI